MTGDQVWKRHTIPAPGEPGSETWPADSWRNGGGSVWLTGNYDPALNLTYWGVGNGGPWTGDARPGDNLYTNSTIALDADSGELRDHYQLPLERILGLGTKPAPRCCCWTSTGAGARLAPSCMPGATGTCGGSSDMPAACGFSTPDPSSTRTCSRASTR